MRRKLLRRAFFALVWLCIWSAAAALSGSTLLLPSPLETARAFLDLARRGAFWGSVAASVGRVLLGFLLGLSLGALLAALTRRFAWAMDFFSPLLSAVKATPVASFIVLALIWVRTNGVPVVATFLVVLPGAFANLAEGIASTDRDLLEMARAFGMRPLRRIQWIYWPTVRPYFRAAAATGMGMAWKAGVAAEIICLPRDAMGTWLYNAKIYLDTPALFAATLAVILLSILLEKAVVRMAKKGGEGEGHA